MLRLVTCLTEDHDLSMVVLAAIVCTVGSYSTLRLLGRVTRHEGVARWGWFAAAVLAFGCAVWSTHFVAMLAYSPTLSASHDFATTVASLCVALAGGAIAFLLVAHASRWTHAAVAGVVLGLAVAGMHFLGMKALWMPALFDYDRAGVAVSLGAGSAFGAAAMLAMRLRQFILGTVALVLAICSLHFGAMSATTVIPLGLSLPPEIEGAYLWNTATAIAVVSLVLLLAGLVGVVLDHHLDRRARQETERLSRFADASFEGILFHRAGRVTDANSALHTLRGGPAPLAGRTLDELFVGGVPPAGSDGDVQEAELLRSDGTHRPVEVLQRLIERDGQPTGVLVLRDIAPRRQAEQAIERLAHYDPLTGLANRALFRDRLAQSLAAAQRLGHEVALLCVDLDRFKTVNDLLGHPCGDKVLTTVALRIEATVREMDTAARLGGDEFAVIVPIATQSAAAQVAARLVEALAAPIDLDGRQVSVGASIGIGLYPQDGGTAETLLRNTDLAMYRAKQSGRSCFRFFEEEMDTKQQERARLEQDLRRALNAGELRLHYQAQYDSRTLALTGYEALLRWEHPQRGQISPAEFVPIAEECGLIGPIGHWVLKTACTDALLWPDHLAVAVNLSPAQFGLGRSGQDTLLATVAEVLKTSGLEPRRLELEITEGVLIKDADQAVATLEALGKLGVRVAMDDFGTGYSSLSYLQRLPLDTIKIDRSFVRNMGEDASAKAIVSAIIGLARNLNVTVTAEGVETEEQLERLQQMKCDHVQGFLLGRPMAHWQLSHAPMASPVPTSKQLASGDRQHGVDQAAS